MPYRRRRRRPRHHAASRIQSAWRRKKRKRFGLTARTALSNRRQIQKVKKLIETKISKPLEATLATNFRGSWINNLVVDNAGLSGGAPFYFHPVYTQISGTAATFPSVNPLHGVVGRWSQMKSLTLKGCVTARSSSGASMYQRTTFILCHDSKPTLNPVLVSSGASPNDGLLDPQLGATVNNRLDTAFYNLNTTGKDGRYKVLKRWTVTVSPHVDLSSYTVPAISTTAAGVAPNVYGNTVRPQYAASSLGLSKKYPPQVYFSHTIQKPYKFNWGAAINTAPSRIPENQNIILFAFSTNGPGMTATSPTIQLVSRFRFKDP